MSDRRRDDTIRAVDLFCGAGGLSTGLALACEHLNREVELLAINHWETAIDTHRANHPWADHRNAKVEELHPRVAVPSERIDLLAAAPECTHFSTARGGRPVDPQKRASPWHILRWLEHLYIDNFILENVPEFVHWSPVGADGTPMQSQQGETFDAYVNTLHSLGYSIDWQVLNAADYGDATSRERLFLIGRRQHRPEWPVPTHSEGGAAPDTIEWRSAAAIIDWSDPGESIWTRNRPLVQNTMQRIAEGIRRYGHETLTPYADAIGSLTKAEVAAMQDDAIPTEDVREIITQQDDPFLVAYDGSPSSPPTDEPVALCVPYILGQQSNARPRNVTEDAVPTIATRGAISLIDPQSVVLPQIGSTDSRANSPAAEQAEQESHTSVSLTHDGQVVLPYLVPFYSETNQRPRTHDIDEPVPTITATGSQLAVTRPYLIQYNGQSSVLECEAPLPTVTTRDRFALCLPDLYPWGLDIRFRMLQPRELAAAMGFPADYEFCGTKTETIEQIGNAVPVNLAQALCERLLAGRDPTLLTYGSTEYQ
jgi:DNA (cytosine-5)-methyltransferase 1